MNYRADYNKWLNNVNDLELLKELHSMDETTIQDAFCCDLTFGTAGLRGIMGAGTNRMNIHVVAKTSQGLANYLGNGASVVIGYDNRTKSDVFAKVASEVFAANGITVFFWPELMPVPAVSYAVRHLHASQGVMITASHNPSEHNGYKVYGADGCQITTEVADDILKEIKKVDIFADVRIMDFDQAVAKGRIKFIEPSLITVFLEEVKEQSVLFGDRVDRDVAIVYSPLNGTGLKPVTRVLKESGFTNITVVEEQRLPDGNFPTCPHPNPESRDAMELGLEYCNRVNADLLIATDPDCDRCGIAVKDKDAAIEGDEYRLLTGNEVGALLLDYICAQRTAHDRMPDNPVFIKTIVTTALAEKIAGHYGVCTINVLTGFKYIGEQIGRLKDEHSYLFGFEESYGYLAGSYARDKDAVNAAFMICEMFAFYKTMDISLLEKLDELYNQYGYSLDKVHSYEFPGSAGVEKMESIMAEFHEGLEAIGGEPVIRTEDYSLGVGDLPKADVLKFYMKQGSVVIRPSGTEAKLKVYVSVSAGDKADAEKIEKRIIEKLEERIM